MALNLVCVSRCYLRAVAGHEIRHWTHDLKHLRKEIVERVIGVLVSHRDRG